MTRIIDLEGVVEARTTKAVLFESSNTGERGWLPLSQIEIDHDHDKGQDVVTLPEWLALDKGLI